MNNGMSFPEDEVLELECVRNVCKSIPEAARHVCRLTSSLTVSSNSGYPTFVNQRCCQRIVMQLRLVI